MQLLLGKRTSLVGLTVFILLLTPLLRAEENVRIFNVKNYGATGKKADDAQKAIQKAVDDCAKAGGGTVYLPPGEYTSGTIYLRSHVRFYIEQGATLFASKDRATYSLPSPYSVQRGDGSLNSLFLGVDVENVTLEGRGTVDGEGTYEWRTPEWRGGGGGRRLRPRSTAERTWHSEMTAGNMAELAAKAEARGKPLRRSWPTGYERDNPNVWYPHLVEFIRCKDVRVAGLTFLRSWSWTFYVYGVERMVIDGIYIYTSLEQAVWADGIDMDSSKDIRIANSTIETGDDCIIFISANIAGPARLCENITITNCRFSSASAAIKFSEGNFLGCRKIVVDNCVITNCNRGITFQICQGGYISDVIISNITMDLHRYDYFWAGYGNPFNFRIERLSEWNREPPKPGEAPPGSIRNVIIRDVIARVQGSSIITGHPESWLDGITFENIKLFMSTDPNALYDRSVHALSFRWARNLKLKDVEVIWDKPALDQWQSALRIEDVSGLTLDGFAGRQAWPDRDTPAVIFTKVSDAVVRNSQALEGTKVFLKVAGQSSRAIGLYGNDFRKAQVPYQVDSDVRSGEVKAIENFLPAM